MFKLHFIELDHIFRTILPSCREISTGRLQTCKKWLGRLNNRVNVALNKSIMHAQA